MSLNAANVSFGNRYQLNANQTLGNQKDCLLRDYMIGVWSGYAKNGDEINGKLQDFYKGEYEQNNNAPCNIIMDLPDGVSAEFENCMKKVGQKFNRLA